MCTRSVGAKALAAKARGHGAMLYGGKQRSQTALRYYLKQGLALLLITGLSACGGSSKSEPEGGATVIIYRFAG
jgi:hypothetical protein